MENRTTVVETDFREAVRQGLSQDDWEPFSRWNTDIGLDVDTDALRYLVEVFNDPLFLSSLNSHKIVLQLSFNWTFFSEEDKHFITMELVPIFASNFDVLTDEMSNYVICDLLGRYIHDEVAFDHLHRLASRTTERLLPLVLMGVGLIVQETSDVSLQRKCLDFARGFARSPNPEVAEQAALVEAKRVSTYAKIPGR